MASKSSNSTNLPRNEMPYLYLNQHSPIIITNQKTITFILTVIAVVLGLTLLKHFDIKTFTTAKPALDGLYLVVFVACVYLVVKNKRDSKNQKMQG